MLAVHLTFLAPSVLEQALISCTQAVPAAPAAPCSRETEGRTLGPFRFNLLQLSHHVPHGWDYVIHCS